MKNLLKSVTKLVVILTLGSGVDPPTIVAEQNSSLLANDGSDTPILLNDNRKPQRCLRQLEMLCPNGGESYRYGVPLCISWQNRITSGDCAELRLSTDGGLTYPILLVEMNEPTTASTWIWSEHHCLGTRLRVAIIVFTHDVVYFDASDGNFAMLRKPSEGGSDTPYLSCAPNPFNSTTILSISLAAPEQVTLRIFDITGRVVAELYDGTAPPGISTYRWNAANVATGLYLAEFLTPQSRQIIKLTLAK